MRILHQQDMKYDLVIFDFDGTIADTSEGIIDAHIFTLKSMNRVIPCNEDLQGLIGKSLLDIYLKVFDFSETEAKEAISIYRGRYSKIGIYKFNLYDEICDTIENLKKRDIKIGIASLKAESFIVEMLEDMHIHELFDYVCGIDENDYLNKTEILRKCLFLSGVDIERTIFVGDSKDDYIGASNAGVNFLGVTYGFGFNRAEEYSFPMVNSPYEIGKHILI